MTAMVYLQLQLTQNNKGRNKTMKKAFETPSIRISKFHRESILTTSGEMQTATEKAKNDLTSKYNDVKVVTLTW